MDYKLTDNDRLKLQNLISTNEVEDQTSNIREKKHSDLIRNQIEILKNLLKLKNNYKNEEEFDIDCQTKASFLFVNYTDIYNKFLKNELNLDILNKFLDALKDIEDGILDQHEASVKVGMFLKQLYVDSALKKAENNDKKHESEVKKHESEVKKDKPKPELTLTWKEFKLKNYGQLV